MLELLLTSSSLPTLYLDSEEVQIKVLGTVHIQHIYCSTIVKKLHIVGDVLYVNNPEKNIAIGVPADKTLSYGRWYMPESDIMFDINCKEIHTSSGTPGCGIGVYAKRSITEEEFGDDCKVRDTPIGFTIYNEPLNGSTKHSADPVYRTVTEHAAFVNEKGESAKGKLGYYKSIPVVTQVMSEVMDATKLGSEAFERSFTKLIDNLLGALNSVTEPHFAECVQRIFSSMLKALIDRDSHITKEYTTVFQTVGYICLFKEIELVKNVSILPISMRYLTVALDAIENDHVEVMNEKQMTSWEEIGLTDQLISLYNHPTDMDYTKQCYRVLYGLQFYSWMDEYSGVISPKLSLDNDTISSNVYMAPAYQNISWLPRTLLSYAISLDWQIWCVADEYRHILKKYRPNDKVKSVSDVEHLAFVLPPKYDIHRLF